MAKKQRKQALLVMRKFPKLNYQYPSKGSPCTPEKICVKVKIGVYV